MKRFTLFLICITVCNSLISKNIQTIQLPLVETSEKTAQSWKYTKTEPSAEWTQLNYEESGWTEGLAGFGKDVLKPNTVWDGKGWIYLRKKFKSSISEKTNLTLSLRLFNDDQVEVYINGGLAYKSEPGYVLSYVENDVYIEGEEKFIKNGENVIAVRCYQDGGGQFIDCGLNAVLNMISLIPTADETTAKSAVEWKYTTTAPLDSSWINVKFIETESWKSGKSGFGGKDFVEFRGSAATNTLWKDGDNTDIWLRKIVKIPNLTDSQKSHLQFKTFYDDDIEVYINGVAAFVGKGFCSSYVLKPLRDEAKININYGGENTIAVKAHQGIGGQYIDLGLYTTEN